MREILLSTSFIGGLIVSALCLAAAFWLTDFQSLLDTLNDFDPMFAAVGFAFTFIHIFIRNARWVAMLDARVGFANALWAQGVGFIFTLFMPLRLGDGVRAIVLAGIGKISIWSSGMSVIMERGIDVFALLCLAAVLVPFIGLDGMPANGMAKIIMAIVLVVIAAWVALKLIRRFASVRFATMAGQLKNEFTTTLQFLCRPNVAAQVGLLTLLGWIVGVFRHWMILLAFVPDATLVQSAFLTIMLTLAISVPSSPGFIGVFQFVGQQALVIPFAATFDPASALSITIALHLCLLITCTVIGIIGIMVTVKRMGEDHIIGRIFERARDWKQKIR